MGGMRACGRVCRGAAGGSLSIALNLKQRNSVRVVMIRALFFYVKDTAAEETPHVAA